MPLRISQPATMPHRPTIEPTDRSMPPVTMTKVMPMARKALSATCFDMMTHVRRRQEVRRGEGEEDDDEDQRDEGAAAS